MSNQPSGLLTLTDIGAADAPCCPPIAAQRIPAETAAVLAPAFKALGDPIRLQLMSMIASAPDGEICVCDLTPAFDLSGPTISHHLKTLREAGLVDSDRRGTWVYYRPRPGVLRQLAGLLSVEAPSSV
ncbi:transcriptional regulator [Virgisporangium aliadipatigenens]|uniref:Transcriptional regulator n=1 Tax=Virgisporangium aliadipatigenens TaxID=741659 RepID=A0A8J3YUZ1_9ACTN|nr:metalloregulator ArsR/SmtB family transcription factor [Virgisporangium aliadipatigenens]GIJ52399.1 transcriptional regulator [Virgisporangium aliadipatigenens]